MHGDRAMYDFATIPAVDAAGWLSVGAATVDFSAGSTLCGTPCSCLDGADFTYFQTTFSIPDGFRLDAFEVAMESVDDGTRVTVFNDRNPTGTTDPGAFAMFPSGTTVRLERLLVTGLNRVVLTHVDDCCSGRTLRGVRVRINSGNLEQCR